jgi:hypothetical protein
MSGVSVSVIARLVVLIAIVVQIGACDSGGGEMAVLDIDPKVGHTQGDQPIRIVGQNFRQDIGYTIYFGANKAGTVTILNPETILVTTPGRMDEGKVDITIRADDGTAFRIAEGFEFKEMAGSVVGGLGETGETKKEEKGNLAY